MCVLYIYRHEYLSTPIHTYPRILLYKMSTRMHTHTHTHTYTRPHIFTCRYASILFLSEGFVWKWTTGSSPKTSQRKVTSLVAPIKNHIRSVVDAGRKEKWPRTIVDNCPGTGSAIPTQPSQHPTPPNLDRDITSTTTTTTPSTLLSSLLFYTFHSNPHPHPNVYYLNFVRLPLPGLALFHQLLMRASFSQPCKPRHRYQCKRRGRTRVSRKYLVGCFVARKVRRSEYQVVCSKRYILNVYQTVGFCYMTSLESKHSFLSFFVYKRFLFFIYLCSCIRVYVCMRAFCCFLIISSVCLTSFSLFNHRHLSIFFF